MVAELRHKRSAPRMVLPFPTASEDGNRYSSDSSGFAPRDGYNGLFTSGLLPRVGPSPTLSCFPSPPRTSIRGPFHPSPEKTTSPNYSFSPQKQATNLPRPPSQNNSPTKTPTRRRRSSMLHTSNPASPRANKASGIDNGVFQAFDTVIRGFSRVAMGTPRARLSTADQQSQWSSSSEESLGVEDEGEESGFWKPRKSGESTRSRTTMKSVATGRSKTSTKSKKSRKSEDTDRMEVDGEELVPPVPALVPLTPGRSRRMMDGLVKRLGLTPRRGKASKGPASASIPHNLPPPPPIPEASDRTIPRKSSFSTLRSALTKKSSSQTLRSVRSINPSSASHPTLNTGSAEYSSPAPPLPEYRWKSDEHEVGCLPMPTTPGRRPRTPKTSIGQPRLQPSTSPSVFIRDMPRRAPGTPKQDGEDESAIPPLPSTTPGDNTFGSITSHPASLDTASPSTEPNNYNPLDGEPDAVENITFTPPALTARAADNALKPKRLLNLLPRQHRLNMGLPTPPPTGLRTKKSTDNIAAMLNRNGAPGIKPLQAKSTNLPPPDASSLILPTKSKGNKREGMSILGRYKPNNTTDENNLPFRSGTGDGWDTPAIRSPHLGYFNQPIHPVSTNLTPTSQSMNNTFGTKTLSPPNQLASSTSSRRVPVPDFTASPAKSGLESDVFKKVEMGKGRGKWGSDLSMSMRSFESDEEGLPSEEWELEAYLRELERADLERAGEGVAR